MSLAQDLQDTRCPRCGSAPLQTVEPSRISRDDARSDAEGEIRHGAISCDACGSRYDVIWETPFLGAFDDQDVIGLIEIAANARADNGYPDAATIRRLERLLVAYHNARDRKEFVRGEPDEMVRAPWFLNRYNEWLHFTTVTAGIAFAGRRVLDVGAGTGTDSYRIVAAGAKVTALEYNPVLVRRGRSSVPEARWIGGLSHALPFVDGSFDIVCCNAALHHMRDVATSLEEMVRVLRPGGWLITTGDPYRARHLGQDHELAVFNRHPAVLLGVNESIPSFNDFERAMDKHRGRINVRVLTDQLYPAPESPPNRPPARIVDRIKAAKRIGDRVLGRRDAWSDARADGDNSLRWWDFDRDRETLANSSGTVAFRCQVKKGVSITPHCQGQPVLEAGEYADSLFDYQESIQRLAPFVPADYVNTAFPGAVQDKFMLLNGWLAPEGGRARSAYRRARWFLRRPAAIDSLTFSIRYQNDSASAPIVANVLVNGEQCLAVPLLSEWRDAEVPLQRVAAGSIFVAEIQLETVPTTFEEGLFEVQDRNFN